MVVVVDSGSDDGGVVDGTVVVSGTVVGGAVVGGAVVGGAVVGTVVVGHGPPHASADGADAISASTEATKTIRPTTIAFLMLVYLSCCLDTSRSNSSSTATTSFT